MPILKLAFREFRIESLQALVEFTDGLPLSYAAIALQGLDVYGLRLLPRELIEFCHCPRVLQGEGAFASWLRGRQPGSSQIDEVAGGSEFGRKIVD